MSIERRLKWPSFRPVPFAATLILFLAATAATAAARNELQKTPRTGKEIFLENCAACHGADGKGRSRSRVGFDQPLPDFTDVDFVSREPEADWGWIASRGGPTRAFSEIMPAFGKALTKEEIALAVGYIHTFADDRAWPRGELNFPRPLVTGKAFPEDEAVFSAEAGEGLESIKGKFTYEQRFGARNQWEVVVPFGWSEQVVAPPDPATNWSSSLGDIVVAVKRAFYHNFRKGSILSGSAELIVPTGDERTGFGKGTFVFEPFLAFGQILPGEFILQTQVGMEIPFQKEKAVNEAFFRVALGRSINFKPWGRTWSPMVEILAAKELVSGEKILFDVVPQVQVTLSKRQHIRFNVGVRLPLNETSDRNFAVMAYLLWDWFDGMFFDGW
jgi:mono/diheme cytochrome c family protein